jgi:anti-sigma-K factor RskA
MENIDNFIADYWNDNLSAADRKIFEEKCATDNDFAKKDRNRTRQSDSKS